ncbi:hypothetical protein RM843_002093 [Salmonella enterica]|nr:hypothetical protein [Salmonella enterica]EBG5099667.1 hypothetical protein [Salmonella enterica subsp. enterica serovar India]EBG5204019.1 hypothetical protein [Salmonella enterica subsp. enterica serovar Geraldton]ECI4108792.1 hypothetical protein [Salmonella enterica subsp. enterica]ECI6406121.1 hypothetical protein [Salmonella enterica subsp. enterica]
MFTVGTIILATSLLSGRVNEERVNHLSSNIHTLNTKIDRLQRDINALRPEVHAAKAETSRANTRLDAKNFFDCLRLYSDY